MWSILRTPWRGLLLAAGLVLAGTALLHASAWPLLYHALGESRLDPYWQNVVQGMWVLFVVHLGVIALYLVIGALRPTLLDHRALFICAVLLAADTGVMGGFMGTFAGTLLLGIATVVVIVARTARQRALEGSG